jgi:hypothetical protein
LNGVDDFNATQRRSTLHFNTAQRFSTQLLSALNGTPEDPQNSFA